jgi:glycosyltransferase involved in cell wall biosynthesis
MRILHLGKYYAPYHGGMETVLQNQVEGLLEAGLSVRVLVAGTHNLDTGEYLKTSSPQGNYNLLRAGNWGTWHSQPLTLNLFSLLRQQLSVFNPDLVHLHLPNPWAVACWQMLGKIQKMPRLVIWHHADITRQQLGARLLHPMMDACRRQAKGIAVSTDALKEHSHELVNFVPKVKVIPFGIKDPEPREISPKPGKSFLFIGRLVAYKGLNVLIKAMTDVPGSELDIVGSGPLLGPLKKQIRTLGLEDRVRIRGSQTPEELNDLLANCRALVLPSVTSGETFGMVQLEAMALGKPLIASDLPTGVAEICRPEKTGLLVEPRSVSSLAAALGRCLYDDDLVADWGKQARKVFVQEYTRDMMITKLVDWYSGMLEK